MRERHLSLSFQRALVLFWQIRGGRENMIGEATKKPGHKSELVGHIDEERDTQVDFIASEKLHPACKKL